ncbi:NADH-quinone oxidoreductase subunit A [Microbacterium sp. LRZ72]|uniref:NADH-quinone oxidoreductase subunit A n=1 Tax=Microbacterium sp. LRZ72 TaxID=2942481 RepID=UPI0029ADE7DE|nr:NADH-quinone oxidoreductase subunit A [Microbacterium sp. LRZ72]MDX2377728.1 NADH-quinone oxidoreductase subunit A [Microbacterium sp. LRZ72]
MHTGLASMLLVSLLGVVVLQLVHRWTTVAARPVQSSPFQSGWLPEQHALSRFHVRWYPATIVFLAFDVEMLFMYPWAVVVGRLGAGAVTEMFLFLGALLVGVLWAWREGVFRWV